jgi:hypothetical protein
MNEKAKAAVAKFGSCRSELGMNQIAFKEPWQVMEEAVESHVLCNPRYRQTGHSTIDPVPTSVTNPSGENL